MILLCVEVLRRERAGGEGGDDVIRPRHAEQGVIAVDAPYVHHAVPGCWS
jgi:hypothetical protein